MKMRLGDERHPTILLLHQSLLQDLDPPHHHRVDREGDQADDDAARRRPWPLAPQRGDTTQILDVKIAAER